MLHPVGTTGPGSHLRSRAGGRAISVFRREKSQEYLAALGPRSCDTLTL